MANAAASDNARWAGPALLVVLAVTAARIVVLWFDQKQLFVDEAQYWFWGQDLAFGYFSKPPAIGWLIRGVTDLAGSDAPFWVRFPAPVLHGATAMLLGMVTARLAGGVAAVWTVSAYLTLPIVAVGSMLMTTDTLMFPFITAAYLLWSGALEEDRPALGAAAGVCLGLGFLAKYAAIYFGAAACLTALLVRPMRPSGRVALWALAAFLLAISPNLIWNLSNGLITVQHTVDNIEWARDPAARLGLEWDDLGEFAVAQLMVFGPLFLPALFWATMRWRELPSGMRSLILFSVPIILLVCVQAALSRAYANWAAAAYLTGTVAVVLWLLPRSRGWLAVGVGVNAAICIALAVIVTLPPWLPDRVREATMQRYLGRVELTEAIVETARAQGLKTVVASNRDILADLFYTGRDLGIAFRAVPVRGRPPHHYAMSWAFEGGDAPVLYVGDNAPNCAADAEPVARYTPDTGYWSERPKAAWRVPGSCWDQ